MWNDWLCGETIRAPAPSAVPTGEYRERGGDVGVIGHRERMHSIGRTTPPPRHSPASPTFETSSVSTCLSARQQVPVA